MSLKRDRFKDGEDGFAAWVAQARGQVVRFKTARLKGVHLGRIAATIEAGGKLWVRLILHGGGSEQISSDFVYPAKDGDEEKFNAAFQAQALASQTP